MNRKNGFTLVELLAVIIILGLLAVIVIPNVQESLGKSKEKLLKINKEQIADSAKLLAEEVIYCNMSDEAKAIFTFSDCDEVKKRLYSGYEINVAVLKSYNLLKDEAGKCEGSVIVKVDSENYNVSVNTDNVTCNLQEVLWDCLISLRIF